ncbi:MAG: membrane protein insertion efficiency factor YidD [Candidatus Melainabacteria bacterium]|nr:membrane protein insertion efficiency factor YidD [Candidatus Melainabacteria bacterium]
MSITAVPQAVLVLAIRLYQKTHLFRSPSCRFYPTCSEYMAGSVTRFGVVKGAALGLLRLCKCHPWNDGGVDMVPTQAKVFGNVERVEHSLHHGMQR